EGPSSIFFPSVVTVSGEEPGRAAALLEDRDTPTIVAPNRVSTTVPGFTDFAGTSASAPHAAGVAALVLQALGFGAEVQSSGIESSIVSSRQAEEVTNIITGTADDIPPAGYDNVSGFGSINALAAVEEAIGENPQPSPSPPPTSPPGNNGSDGSGGCSVYGPADAHIGGTVLANALILLIPAFVTAFGFLRRRKQ
ncbi:MAG TPA: S8 family serine peptidase, partial [Thermodesulfobacteriota bacterium]|nr:S8 family serine peptidase [Thermodesulfobacteriota bacterium]